MINFALDASTDEVDTYGNTALHLAARYGHESVLVILLERKVDHSGYGK